MINIIAPRQSILVTGALGYIGSHTVVELLLSDLNVDIVALDNLSNSSLEVLEQIKETVALVDSTFQAPKDRLTFIEGDVTDAECMRKVFKSSYNNGQSISGVIHFAALKSVSESLLHPTKYYRENVGGLTTLLGVMEEWDCKQIIFSSSATVYGALSGNGKCLETLCRHAPSEEDVEGVQGSDGLANPYGRTKWMCEAILQDSCVADPDFKAVALRYFNPIGAYPVGKLRESPRGSPTNLVPCITRAMEAGRQVNVFGTDYNTKDGSAIRDYIHVVDLAQGHVAALKSLTKSARSRQYRSNTLDTPPYSDSSSSESDATDDSPSLFSPQGVSSTSPTTPPTPFFVYFQQDTTVTVEEVEPNNLQVYNLGTGEGSTVKEVIRAIEVASRHKVSVVEVGRRKGDVERYVADPTKAKKELDWHASRTLNDACVDICRHLGPVA